MSVANEENAVKMSDYDEGFRAGMQIVLYLANKRIEDLEAKLAECEARLEKAVEFIEDLTGCEWPYCEDAKRVLAELKGQDDE